MTRRTVLAWISGMTVTLLGCKKYSPLYPGWPMYPEKLVKGVWTTYQGDVEKWELACRKKLASQTPSIGLATCESCGLPWWCVDGHTVIYEDGSGCFAACEMCWKNLGADVLPFYEAWVTRNYPGDIAKLERVRRMESM